MKVACLTCFVPRRENINGPCGLLFQTLKWRPAQVSVTVFLFGQISMTYRNVPEVVELAASGVQFVYCPARSKNSPTPSYWPMGARQIANFDMPNLNGFDAVWAYPYWFAPFLLGCRPPILISGMDCATLLYWRKLKNTSLMKPTRFLRTAAGLIANFLFESRYLRGRQVHVVGQADAEFLQRLAVRAIYIPHPVLAYPLVTRPARHAGKVLTVLLSNPGDPVYGSPRYLGWVLALFRHSHAEPRIRLIVHKGSLDAIHAINTAAKQYPNVTVELVTWVDDYSVFLSMIDIQLFPLDVGAGTKTSVLTALQHGVYAICSPVAAENIQSSAFLFVANDQTTHFEDALAHALVSLNSGDTSGRLPRSLAQHSPKDCGLQFWAHLENHVK
jgi:glycosyltransferase involved in cell wall biosynthesis